MATRRRASRRTLTGSLSDIDRRLKFVETRPAPSRLANQVVTREKLQPRAVSTDQIQLLSITNSLIEKRTIGEAELDENSVTSLQVAPEAITTESFAPGAVDNAAMGDNAVGTDNVQDGSVTEPKLANGATSTDKISDGAITTAKLANGSVTEPKIASSAVTESKINNGAVTESKIALQAVTEGKIASGAVTNAKIGNGAVTNAKLGNGSVSTEKIANDAVNGDKIANGSINNRMIVPGNAIATAVAGGSGINVSGSARSSGGSIYTISADFGTGSNDIPRGNHVHPIGGAGRSARTGSGGEDDHDHSYFDQYSAGQTSPVSSSKRMKKDITDHVIDDPKKILKLRPKRYKYKNSRRGNHIVRNKEWLYGYLAEEVLEAGVEEIVAYNKKGEPNALDYSILPVLIVELVRAQQAEIDSLSEEVKRLKEER